MIIISRKKSIYLILLFSLLLLCLFGLSLGPYIDLQVSELLFTPSTFFARLFYLIGPWPCIWGMTTGAVLLITSSLKKRFELQLLSWIFGSLICLAGTFYFFSALKTFGSETYWINICLYVGLYCSPPALIAFLSRKKSSKQKMYMAIYLLITSLGSLILVSGLKELLARPRFIALKTNPEIPFHNWFEPFGDSPSYWASRFSMEADTFKSFPSAHTASAAVSLTWPLLLAWFNKKKVYIVLSSLFALCFTFITAFSRLVAGAHFISDVSGGFLVTLLFLFIGYYYLKKSDSNLLL